MLFVQDVDLTPNPLALKFILNEKLLRKESRSYSNIEQAKDDPFAKSIFEINGVVSVFYMDKFVTIEKTAEVSWGDIQKPFAVLVQNFNKELIPAEAELSQISTEEESEMLKKINQVIDQRVRPALAGDGGGLEILGLENLTLTIRYQGACGSCPSAIRGTLVAIENLLRKEVNPDIEVIPG